MFFTTFAALFYFLFNTIFNMQKEKFFELLGWVGMTTSILMYVFYFQQIQQNLGGIRATSCSLLWRVSTVLFG
jgi:integral membrane protein